MLAPHAELYNNHSKGPTIIFNCSPSPSDSHLGMLAHYVSGINSINQKQPRKHRSVSKEHLHLVTAPLYLLSLRQMGLLTKGTLANHGFFSYETFRVLCRLCWAPPYPAWQSHRKERFRYLRKGQPWKKAALWGCISPNHPTANTGDVSLPKPYLFLHYQHPILNFRKACESSDVTALNCLLECSAFLLILSPRQNMSPHSFFIHQLQNDSPCWGGEGSWTWFSQAGTRTHCSPPSFEGSAPLWLEQKSIHRARKEEILLQRHDA